MTQTGMTFRLESRTQEVSIASHAALERALKRVAIHWHALARQAAPVDTGRLQASIAFAAPGTNPAVMADGEVFQPPPVTDLSAIVGSNVEYAAAVHEGVEVGTTWSVPEHSRGPFTRKDGVSVRQHTVRSHMATARVMRAPRKFIESPVRENESLYQRVIIEELERLK